MRMRANRSTAASSTFSVATVSFTSPPGKR
jgi:hypothetical protein